MMQDFKMFFKLLVMIMLAIPQLLTAQNIYQVGSAQNSLEPPSDIFSVSLAGYGAPRDGRFSLEWTKKDQPEAIVALLNQKEKLYTKLFKNAKQTPGDKLPKNSNSFAILKHDLVIIDQNDVLWKATKEKNLSWQKIGLAPNIIDLVVHHDQLYGLTGDNEILRYQPNADWLRIAIKNGLTYKQDIKRIAVFKEHLYGIDATNTVLIAQHKTDNNLTAHALAVKSGHEHVVLVSLDLCGFDGSFISEVKEVIEKKYHIPSSAILVNASHTHFAPVSQKWTTWGPHCQKPDSTYLYGTVKPAIIASIGAAIKSEKDANIYFGRGVTAIGANRSLKDAPIPYDKDVDVLKVVYKNEAASDVLFMHGCHPVFLNQNEQGITISANYPAVTRDLLSKDPHINNSMFIQGCAGDINPVDADHHVTGSKLASAVQNVLADEMTAVTGGINHYLDTINFPVTPWPKEKLEAFKQQNSGHDGDVGAEKNVRWADLMLHYEKTDATPKQMPVYVQTVNIGNWKLVGLSREVVTEYSLGIKKLWPDQLVSVAGYTNDVSSYLPTRRHIQAGVYEGNDSFFWYGQPNIFPEHVYETIINSIKAKNR